MRKSNLAPLFVLQTEGGGRMPYNEWQKSAPAAKMHRKAASGVRVSREGSLMQSSK